jgi:hypothetical protein
MVFEVEHDDRLCVRLHGVEKMLRLGYAVRAGAEMISAEQQASVESSLAIALEGLIDIGLALGGLLDDSDQTRLYAGNSHVHCGVRYRRQNSRSSEPPLPARQ